MAFHSVAFFHLPNLEIKFMPFIIESLIKIQPTSDPPMSSDVLGKATSGIGYLIGFRFLSKLITFLFGLFVVRRVSPEMFGIGNIQLQLYLNVILVLSRQGFRKSITRYNLLPESSKKKALIPIRSLLRIIWCVIPMGLLITTFITIITLQWRSEEERAVDQYLHFILISAVAVLVEIVSEPFWLMLQMLFKIKERVAIEAMSMVVRCIVIFLCVFLTQLDLLSFSIGQVSFSLSLLFMFLFYFFQEVKKENADCFPFHSMRELLPTFPSSYRMEGETKRACYLVLGFSWQAIEILILQESEKFVLKFTNSLTNQGVFSVVSNLGALVIRFLFQPIEEMSFTLFSKLLSVVEEKELAKNISVCASLLSLLLKTMIYIGLIFICFGTNYSTELLELLYGDKYGRESGAPLILSCYCIFVFFSAINGITEGFFSASATPKQLRYHNIAMVAFSIIYVTACVLLVRYYHTPGLIFANCINMSFRICFALFFTTQTLYAVPRPDLVPLSSAIPNKIVLCIFIICYVITSLSEKYFYLSVPRGFFPFVEHTAVGCGCLFLLFIMIYKTDKEYLSKMRNIRTQKTKVQ